MERRLPDLPQEIIHDILSRLPVKPLCRFKLVSKPWLALISNPQFIKSRLHQSMKHNMNQKLFINPRNSASLYSIDYKAPDHTVAEMKTPGECREIWGSFNGVYLLNIDTEFICLWNPSIRMCQKISPPYWSLGHRCCMFGLGYDSAKDDFRVVAFVWPKNQIHNECYQPNATLIVHVFSSKLNSWKIIGEFGYKVVDVMPGIIVNGTPHWVVNNNLGVDCRIVGFDAMVEKFREVPRPNCGSKDDGFYLGGVLGGCLCVVDKRQNTYSDVWVMKEYGVKDSWTKLFVISNVEGEGDFFFQFLYLLCFTVDGEVVMLLFSEGYRSRQLVIYNQKQKRFKRIGIPQHWKLFSVDLYVESLVSPYGCNDTRRHGTSRLARWNETAIAHHHLLLCLKHIRIRTLICFLILCSVISASLLFYFGF